MNPFDVLCDPPMAAIVAQQASGASSPERLGHRPGELQPEVQPNGAGPKGRSTLEEQREIW